MSDEVTQAPEAQVPAVQLSSYEYMQAKFPGAPTEAIVQSYKAMVPGGRVRFFELPDGKRAFLLRGVSGLELAAIQAEIGRLADPVKQALEQPIAVAVRGTLWSSLSPKLTPDDLRAAGAGLAGSLQAVIFDLSDFIDPAVMDSLIIDL